MKLLRSACFILFLSTGNAFPQQSSGEWVKMGVQAYRLNRYPEAQTAFEKAVELDSQNLPALHYLAATYMIQWVPGATSPGNLDFREKAKSEFSRILELNPQDNVALASLGSIAYNSAATGSPQEKQAALEEARTWNTRRTEVNAREPEAFYYLGVISWSECFPEIQKARIAAQMRPDQPGPLPEGPAKQELEKVCVGKLNGGIENLLHVLELSPDDSDAMAYLNLTYRLKASLASSPSEALSLVEQAQWWADRSLETKRKQAEQPLKRPDR